MQTELGRMEPGADRYGPLAQRLEYLMTGDITPTMPRNDGLDYYHVHGFIDPEMIQTIYMDLNDFIFNADPKLTESQLTDIYHDRMSNPYIMPDYIGEDAPQWNDDLSQWWIRDDWYWDPTVDKWRRYLAEGTEEIQRWEETPHFDAYIEPPITTDWSKTVWAPLGSGFEYFGGQLWGGFDWLWDAVATWGPIVLIIIGLVVFLWLKRK